MKTRNIIMSVSLIVCSSSFFIEAEEEKERSVFSTTDDFSDETLFEGKDNFEEPEITDIPTDYRERKPEISIKDIPFYLKLFCSYVYEEKLQRWYYAFFGYLAHLKHKK